MKKSIFKKIFLGLLCFGICFFSPSPVNAKSYSIDKVDIQAQLNTNGSMNVEENRIYNFDGDYTFAYEYFKKNGERNIAYILDNFEVCDDLACYKQLDSNDKETFDEKKPVDSFYIDNQSDQYYVKWFYRANSQTKNFKIKYTIENAITLQQDVAELYWQWIGSYWDISQKDVSVNINLPDGIGENIKAYGHGPTNGIVSISDDSKNVSFKTDYLSSGTIFESRVLLPKEIFNNGVTDNLTKTEINQQENVFIEKTETKKQNNKNTEIIINLISFGLFIMGIVWFIKKIIIFNKYGKDQKLPEINLSGRLWEPPSDIDPAQVEQLILGYEELTPKSFTATILSLVQHRFYKITKSERKEGFLFKDYKYYLVPLKKSEIEATSIEKYVLDFLREISNETLELSEIADWCKTHQTKSYKFFKKFPGIVFKENLQENLFDNASHKINEKNNFIFIFLIIVLQVGIMMIGTTKYENASTISFSLIYLLILFVCLFIVISMRTYGEKRTNEGSMEAAQWIAFKKHMKEYNQTKNYPIDSIIIWEKYLVYGTVLGVSTKALSALPVNFNSVDKTVLITTWGGSIDTNGAVSITNVFSSINSIATNMTTAASSYGASGSGSSGGFSGGGGGGGGASGGGAG